MTTLYLAGPMTGKPRWNFDEFARVTKLLRSAGYSVLSPHEADLNHGFDPDAPVEDFTRERLVEAFKRDVELIGQADGLAMLDGWHASSGANAEWNFARGLRIPRKAWHVWLEEVTDGTR